MREVKTIIDKWCDACFLESQADGELEYVPATVAYTIGITLGDAGKPAPKVLDLCEPHSKAIEDLAELLKHVGQLPDPAPVRAAAHVKSPPERSNNWYHAQPPMNCPVCGEVLANRSSLLSHVWGTHRPEGKPEAPKDCPDCGAYYEGGAGMASHRRGTHGWDALTEALAGVKGYKPPKALRRVSQPELTAAE